MGENKGLGLIEGEIVLVPLFNNNFWNHCNISVKSENIYKDNPEKELC